MCKTITNINAIVKSQSQSYNLVMPFVNVISIVINNNNSYFVAEYEYEN